MPFFNITIVGLDERIAHLNEIVNGLETAKQEILLEVSSFMANEMRNNVHVITGNLKSSISSQVLGDTAEVLAGAEYAVYENARVGTKPNSIYNTGPHDFADRAAATTERQAPQIVNSVYDRLFSNY